MLIIKDQNIAHLDHQNQNFAHVDHQNQNFAHVDCGSPESESCTCRSSGSKFCACRSAESEFCTCRSAILYEYIFSTRWPLILSLSILTRQTQGLAHCNKYYFNDNLRLCVLSNLFLTVFPDKHLQQIIKCHLEKVKIFFTSARGRSMKINGLVSTNMWGGEAGLELDKAKYRPNQPPILDQREIPTQPASDP